MAEDEVFDFSNTTDGLGLTVADEVENNDTDLDTEPKAGTRRPRKSGSRLSSEVRLAIRIARADSAMLDRLASVVGVSDGKDVEAVVSGVFKNLDELRSSLKWLAGAALVSNPMELALEVSTLALQDSDQFVSAVNTLSIVGEDVASVKRSDISKSLLPVSQIIAGLSNKQKSTLTEATALLEG
jgi:hypothetical protein